MLHYKPVTAQNTNVPTNAAKLKMAKNVNTPRIPNKTGVAIKETIAKNIVIPQPMKGIQPKNNVMIDPKATAPLANNTVSAINNRFNKNNPPKINPSMVVITKPIVNLITFCMMKGSNPIPIPNQNKTVAKIAIKMNVKVIPINPI